MKDSIKNYNELRQGALNVSADQICIDPTNEFLSVYGILMEIGLSEATVTLVALADGAVGIYYETGGGVTADAEHTKIANAAFRMLHLADRMKNSFTLTKDFALPEKGQVKFFLLTVDGIFSASIAHDNLTEENDLSKLVLAGNDILTELRASDKDKAENPRFKA